MTRKSKRSTKPSNGLKSIPVSTATQNVVGSSRKDSEAPVQNSVASGSGETGILSSDPKLIKRVEERKETKAKKNLQRREDAEKLKEKGNEYFKEGKYEAAIEQYRAAVRLSQRPAYYSNMAAAFLKLECYLDADLYATAALCASPRFVKARFRRAMARKEMAHFRSAIADLTAILRQDPNCAEAKTELAALEEELGGPSDIQDSDDSSEDDFPNEDHRSEPSDVDSDTNQLKHAGNRIACKFYNHDGCKKGDDCAFSHAPDTKSVRDELGKNVCLYYLADRCKFGDKCNYAHSKDCLLKDSPWHDARHAQRVISARALDKKLARKIQQAEVEDIGAFGFTEDEEEELLCQGVMPWDDDAADVLAVLNGDYY